jgi:hypothetical protein
VRHVSCCSGSYLLALRAPGYHVSYGSLWTTGIKHKEKPSKPAYIARLDVPNARAHVSNAPDVRAIMSLQDMLAGNVFNTCKTCGQAAIVQRRPY